VLEELTGLVSRGAVAAGLYLGALWKGDDFLSEAGRKQLYASLVEGTRTPGVAVGLMNRWFGDGVPGGRFVRNIALFSLASLGVLLAIYLARVPGLWGALVESAAAREPFLRQVLSGGLPVVLAVNFFGFMAFAVATRGAAARGQGAARLLLRDVGLRVALFVGLTGLYFLASAALWGSFGGDPMAALRALGPTLLLAATFGDLTGVYLYAAALASFPLFVAGAIEAMQRSPALSRLVRGAFFFLPFQDRPVRAVAAVLGVFLALLATAVSLVALLLPGRS
jgi:hypothetical protein